MNKKKPDVELIVKGRKVYLDIGISFDPKCYYQTKESHYASVLDQDDYPKMVTPSRLLPQLLGKIVRSTQNQGNSLRNQIYMTKLATFQRYIMLQNPCKKLTKRRKTQSETVSDQHLNETSDQLNSSIQINQNEKILLSLAPAIQEEIQTELRMPNKTTVTKIQQQNNCNKNPTTKRTNCLLKKSDTIKSQTRQPIYDTIPWFKP
ncbi:Hypothetical_protein [Hexamita inflata]|uniref:Hypothetical_protein n=1 Tax=Hexamita inflata TaxID=28002 RepID=A0AA86RKZ8_9EUKA|nr:Hypothetical protein HINF_LOCUS63203 [Hexamita inflata]